MVLVPAGPFMMGCNEELDAECRSSAIPYHEVALSAFEIDRLEVTQAEYASCVDEGLCSVPTLDYAPDLLPNRPITWTEWEDARTYCEWVGKRLPTEAEWEKAARGTDGRIYPWGNEPPDCTLAVYGPCRGDEQDVGQHPEGASPYGALDMSGNASEWVSDWFDRDYYATSPATNPPGPDDGTSRVVRGGSQGGREDTTRVFDRLTEAISPNPGIRCARSAAE